jgi:Reverse transcriptase (RNA-dependent DNA polymerase)
MFCTRLDYWAEKHGILSKSQYGFRKGRGTRDCLAIFTTDVQISFEKKQETVAAFLDISCAYYNVLIDILCGILCDIETPKGTVRFLWNLLKHKVLVFHAENEEKLTLTGYKGLPQGSVLSPFLYNILGSRMDRFLPSGCRFLQYADDVVVYATHRVLEIARSLIQTACTSLSVFFSMMALTISPTKSELMLFSRKHDRQSLTVYIDGRPLPQTKFFKYLGVFFDEGLRWAIQANYIQRRSLKRINFLKAIAGISWGAHPRCMLLLYKGLIAAVIEYGSICFSNMAKCHLAKI